MVEIQPKRTEAGRSSRRTFWVAVVGGSGTGKTWLADRLAEAVGKECGRLSLDMFYRDRSYLSAAQRARLNFDQPQAVDWLRLEEVLRELDAGRSAQVPRYRFADHVREPADQVMKARPVFVVEGLWLLRRRSIRRMFDLKLFLDCPTGLCLERRLARDKAERGRDEESVRRQYAECVLPMQERYVAPQARWADRILRGVPGAVEIAELVTHIRLEREQW